MRKMWLLTGALVFLLAFGAEKAYAQAGTLSLRPWAPSLDETIQAAAENLSGSLHDGSRIAILSMFAPSDRVSDYIINEMTSVFINMFSFIVVDRAQLDLLAQELEFQMSGYVDDETVQSLGRMLICVEPFRKRLN